MTQQCIDSSASRSVRFLGWLPKAKSLTHKKVHSLNALLTRQKSSFSPGIISQLFTKNFSFLVVGSLVLLCLFSSDVWAMKEDSMKGGLTKLEGYLTGNIARGIVFGGCGIAAYRAYEASKFGVLGAAVAGALGLNFLMDFVNATYACLV